MVCRQIPGIRQVRILCGGGEGGGGKGEVFGRVDTTFLGHPTEPIEASVRVAVVDMAS